MGELIPENQMEPQTPPLPVAAQLALGGLLGLFLTSVSVLTGLLRVPLGIWFWVGLFVVLWLVIFVTLRMKWRYFAVGLAAAMAVARLVLTILGVPLW